MHLDPAETNRRAYDDARVVALYDLDNPPGEDHAYFRRAAQESGARRIVDLGCGNGLLVYILSNEGHKGIGIDLRRRKIWDLFPESTHLQVRENFVIIIVFE